MDAVMSPFYESTFPTSHFILMILTAFSTCTVENMLNEWLFIDSEPESPKSVRTLVISYYETKPDIL